MIELKMNVSKGRWWVIKNLGKANSIFIKLWFSILELWLKDHVPRKECIRIIENLKCLWNKKGENKIELYFKSKELTVILLTALVDTK